MSDHSNRAFDELFELEGFHIKLERLTSREIFDAGYKAGIEYCLLNDTELDDIDIQEIFNGKWQMKIPY